MPRPRSWTDEDLRSAVGRSATLNEVCRHLAVAPGGRTYAVLRRHCARLGVDTAHLPRIEARTSRTRSWDDDRLREVVAASLSVSEVLRRLGYRPSGGMHRYIMSRIRMLDLDTGHFLGQSWSRGRANPRGQSAVPLEQILVRGFAYSSHRLRLRLIAAGLKDASCEWCSLTSWRGRAITLELDHVNGDPSDNRLGNLRVLCPNCHAQTETWCRSRRRGVTDGRYDV